MQKTHDATSWFHVDRRVWYQLYAVADLLLVNTATAAQSRRTSSSTRATPDHRSLDRLSRFTTVH